MAWSNCTSVFIPHSLPPSMHASCLMFNQHFLFWEQFHDQCNLISVPAATKSSLLHSSIYSSSFLVPAVCIAVLWDSLRSWAAWKQNWWQELKKLLVFSALVYHMAAHYYQRRKCSFLLILICVSWFNSLTQWGGGGKKDKKIRLLLWVDEGY